MPKQLLDKSIFRFKHFEIKQEDGLTKVTTDCILLGAWIDVQIAQNALDIGTGTGVLALILAQKIPGVKVDAIEIEAKAYAQALGNFNHNIIGKNITLEKTSFQDYYPKRTHYFDVVVSNPPYFSNGILPLKREKTLAKHTIGLNHDELLKGVHHILKQDGFLYLILPQNEGQRVINEVDNFGFNIVKQTDVYSKSNKNIFRILLKLSKNNDIISYKDKLCIMENDSSGYTEEFKSLTKDFYLIG